MDTQKFNKIIKLPTNFIRANQYNFGKLNLFEQKCLFSVFAEFSPEKIQYEKKRVQKTNNEINVINKSNKHTSSQCVCQDVLLISTTTLMDFLNRKDNPKYFQNEYRACWKNIQNNILHFPFEFAGFRTKKGESYAKFNVVDRYYLDNWPKLGKEKRLQYIKYNINDIREYETKNSLPLALKCLIIPPHISTDNFGVPHKTIMFNDKQLKMIFGLSELDYCELLISDENLEMITIKKNNQTLMSKKEKIAFLKQFYTDYKNILIELNKINKTYLNYKNIKKETSINKELFPFDYLKENSNFNAQYLRCLRTNSQRNAFFQEYIGNVCISGTKNEYALYETFRLIEKSITFNRKHFERRTLSPTLCELNNNKTTSIKFCEQNIENDHLCKNDIKGPYPNAKKGLFKKQYEKKFIKVKNIFVRPLNKKNTYCLEVL